MSLGVRSPSPVKSLSAHGPLERYRAKPWPPFDLSVSLRIGSVERSRRETPRRGLRPREQRSAPDWAAGRARLEGRGLGCHRNRVERDELHACFRSRNTGIGSARLREGAQFGEGDAVSRVSSGEHARQSNQTPRAERDLTGEGERTSRDTSQNTRRRAAGRFPLTCRCRSVRRCDGADRRRCACR